MTQRKRRLDKAKLKWHEKITNESDDAQKKLVYQLLNIKKINRRNSALSGKNPYKKESRKTNHKNIRPELKERESSHKQVGCSR